MRCSGCGMTVDSGAGKCPYCGTKVSGEARSGFSSAYGGTTYGGRSFGADFTKSIRQNQSSAMKTDEGNRVYEENLNSIGEITNWTEQCAGSGFVITDDGYTLTNAHVVGEVSNGEESPEMYIHLCGETVRAELVATAPSIGQRNYGVDLAILKLERIPKGTRRVSFCHTTDVKIGNEVYCIGNSKGMGTRITKGIVSDLRNAKHDFGDMIEVDVMTILTDCSINHGNSGGPMFDSKGHVIGVNTWGQVGSDVIGGNMNYAICTDEVEKFVAAVNQKCGLRIRLTYG